jgi:hypothetical protein
MASHVVQKYVLLNTCSWEDWMAGWMRFFSHPSRPIRAPNNAASFDKMKEISKFFGGTPQTGTFEDTPDQNLSLPTLEMPGLPSGPATTTKRKRKEGC